MLVTFLIGLIVGAFIALAIDTYNDMRKGTKELERLIKLYKNNATDSLILNFIDNATKEAKSFEMTREQAKILFDDLQVFIDD